MAFRGDLEALVLGVLAGGRMHGYEIARRINNTGGEVLRVQEGQLYPILHRMENDGLIAADWVSQEGKPNRKVYALTETGHAALREKQSVWAQFAASVSTLLGNSPEVARG